MQTVKIAGILALVFFSTVINTLGQTVTSVSTQQDGNKINIFYNISSATYNQSFDVSVYLSNDGGLTFEGPLRAVEGDVGEVKTGGRRKVITWSPLSDNFGLSGSLVFDVRAQVQENPIKNRFFIGYAGNTAAPLGIALGQVGRTGWKINFNLSPNFFNRPAFHTDNSSLTNYDGSGYYAYNNLSSISRLSITGGVTLRLAKDVMYLSLAGGYGKKNQLWGINEYSYDDDSQTSEVWVKHIDYSYSGLEAEVGLLFVLDKFYLLGGFTTLSGKRYDLTFGLGLAF